MPRPPQSPHKQSKLMARWRRDQLEQEHRAAVHIAAPEQTTALEPERQHELTKPGDPRKLRGIPAIGRSVTGAIPGTVPHLDGLPN